MYYINIDYKRWEFIWENIVLVAIKCSSLEDDFAVYKSLCFGSANGFSLLSNYMNFEVVRKIFIALQGKC